MRALDTEKLEGETADTFKERILREADELIAGLSS